MALNAEWPLPTTRDPLGGVAVAVLAEDVGDAVGDPAASARSPAAGTPPEPIGLGPRRRARGVDHRSCEDAALHAVALHDELNGASARPESLSLSVPWRVTVTTRERRRSAGAIAGSPASGSR